MGVFTDKAPQPELKPKEIADTANHIKRLANRGNNNIVNIYQRSMTMVWENPDGYTPDQLLSAFGTDAEEILTANALLEQLIATTAPSKLYQRPEGITFDIPGDGTASIVWP